MTTGGKNGGGGLGGELLLTLRRTPSIFLFGNIIRFVMTTKVVHIFTCAPCFCAALRVAQSAKRAPRASAAKRARGEAWRGR